MLDCISKFILSLFPAGYNPFDMVYTLGFIVAIVFLMALLIHVLRGKAAKYNHALASAMAILFMYLCLIVTRGIMPEEIGSFLNQLPLIKVEEETISIYSFSLKEFSAGCSQFLHVLILSFILIGLDDIIPDAKNGVSWVILQFFIACLAMVGYWFVLKCINHFMPGVLDSLAPMILVCILLFLALLGVLKVILSLMLVAVSPLLAAVSAFFATSRIGQSIGKAILCSVLLCAVTKFMEIMKYTTFNIADLTLLVCLMPMAVLLGLWVLVGYIM